MDIARDLAQGCDWPVGRDGQRSVCAMCSPDDRERLLRQEAALIGCLDRQGVGRR
ncbi:hypothetical protein [Streptacidiphilus melanogenes]|uniref:hypothetical protein n=1 Tax=Streptacidiphilus melanogenes TaxID=411235 RepID=UPI000A8EF585|nr:hypothetical protein [Streptacidiphilus melanogenes]